MKTLPNFFNRLFNIRTDEWPSVSLLFLIAVLSSAGFVWGLTISYASFLQVQTSDGGQLQGLETLPWILSLIALLSIVATVIYTPFVDRIADDRLMIMIFGLELMAISLGLLLIWFNFSAIAYPFLYLFGFSLIAVINPHQATYFNNFYDTQVAKRAVPVINAGYRVGGILAGLLMPVLNNFFNNPIAIILLWFLTHAAMTILVWLAPSLLKRNQGQRADSPQGQTLKGLPHDSPLTDSEKQKFSYLEDMRSGAQYTLQSTFLRWMALGTLLLMILLALLEYKSTELLLAEFQTAAELADFLALLGAGANFFVVPMLLFGLSRLIARFGLGNTSLIFPLGNLGTCLGLIIWPSWTTASLATLGRTDFRLAFQFPVEGLLYNAVSLKIKGRVRAFISGLLAPVGSLIGGVALILLTVILSAHGVVVILIGLLALAYFISALFIRQQYGQALISMLEQEDYAFLFIQEASDLSVADPATLKLLEQRLMEAADDGQTSPSDPEFTIFMANLVSQIGGDAATPVLTQTVRTMKDVSVRAALIDVMVATDRRGQTVRQLYLDLLKAPDGHIRQSVLVGLERLDGPESDPFRQLAFQHIDDPEIEVRLQVLAALARAPNFYHEEAAVQALERILTAPDSHLQAQGVRILGQIVESSTVPRLIQYLSSPNDAARLEAVLALEALPDAIILSQDQASSLINLMAACLDDPIERVRQAAVIILGRIGRGDNRPQLACYQNLARFLLDPSIQIRNTTIDVFAQAGKSVIPIIRPGLDSPDPYLRKMTTVILSRINKREFGPLILTHIFNQPSTNKFADGSESRTTRSDKI